MCRAPHRIHSYQYYFFFAGPVALLLGFYGACIALLDREQLTPVIEVLAALLCIAGLAGLSGQRTARAGKWAGMTGVLLAVSTTLGGVGGLWPALVYAQFAIIASVGSAIGFVVYRMVSPSSLPQAVAGFHSLVGLAAVLTAAAEYLPKRLAADTAPSWDASSVDDASEPVALLAVGITTVVGGITCAGSIVAFAKLSGLLSSSPLHLPLRDAANALLMAATLAAVVFFASLPASPLGMNVLGAAAACSLVLGVHAVVSIGGTDMPVVITVLNSSSVGLSLSVRSPHVLSSSPRPHDRQHACLSRCHLATNPQLTRRVPHCPRTVMAGLSRAGRSAPRALCSTSRSSRSSAR